MMDCARKTDYYRLLSTFHSFRLSVRYSPLPHETIILIRFLAFLRSYFADPRVIAIIVEIAIRSLCSKMAVC